ncbi:MAG: DNA primase small subunit domain-containing protein [Patescibacteria group bacterium]
MPIDWLINYWHHAGPYALPFFTHRKIALQLKFGDHILYKRHNDDENWININSQKQIDEYAFGHTFSFHPHQLSDDNIKWIMIDIDKRNDKLPFKYIVKVAQIMAGFLDKDKQPYLLKYSGHRGFHFMWSLGKIKPKDIESELIYQKEHQIVEKYTARLEEYFQNSPLTKSLKKYYPPNSPLFSTNSADKKLAHCILIDKNILRPHAVFRSPWSVHPTTGLISAPMEVRELDNFDPKAFTPHQVIPRLKYVQMPA